jgi:hypothetical protein
MPGAALYRGHIGFGVYLDTNVARPLEQPVDQIGIEFLQRPLAPVQNRRP